MSGRNATARRRWQRGVSFGSAGRLGAHAEGFEPDENGYLTYQTAGCAFMLIRPDRRVIGSLQLPPRHRVDARTRSWTLRTTRYRAPAEAGRPAVDLQVLASAISPAVAFASGTDTTFRWRWQVRASPQWTAFPTAGGVTVAHYSRGYPLRRIDIGAAGLFEAGPRDARREPPSGRLRRNGRWLLTFDPAGARNVPLLWVFGGPRPKRIDVTTYEYLDFHFARPFGRIMAMPLYGSAEVDREELAGFCRGEGLDRLRALGDYWADALTGMPDEVDEYFRIDEAAGVVEVRAVGRRLDGRRAGVCPVPPFLSAATRSPYPVRVKSRLQPPPREMLTHYGPYDLVAGPELRYTMPLCPYLDKVLSPMRITGDRRASALARKLRDCFDDPRHTYGGDGTYDPDSLLDILHNLRVLAWAAWSLPADQRPAARQAIVRRFEDLFNARSYRTYREPTTGRTFARDPKIFDWCGDITYDFDWYSGMNLAGLFAGIYFGAIDPAFVRRRWKLVCEIEAYFEIFQDWATLVPWTDCRGETLNIDCARHGAQGMIGFARLAGRFGDVRKRDLARCIASRYMVFWAAEHELVNLYEAGGVAMDDWGRGRHRMVIGFGGLHERDQRPSKVNAAVRNPYTLSPLTPEHMLFLRDYGPTARLQRYESKVLDRAVPGWNTDPATVYFRGRPPSNIEHNTGGYHFYMLDPHLFLRMLALDWPSRRAMAGVTELSGQVIAAALVADAPKVLCPAAIAFAGCEWDAKRTTLTIRGEASEPTTATWEVLWKTGPKRVVGPGGSRHRFRKGKLTLTAKVAGPVEWELRY